MDNNDSNPKSQTGGLKLMTVFIAVLALHVVVIGGFTVYHLMSGGSTDSDLTTTDKSHKGSSDITTAEVTQTDKSTAPTEVATIPATAVTPASAPAPTGDTSPTPIATATPATPSSSASTTSTTIDPTAPIPTPTPAPATVTPTATAAAPIATPALTLNAPTPAAATTTTVTPTAQTPSGPISAELAPPPDVAPVAISPMAPVLQPTAPLAAGPVHMPPANRDASLIHHTHQQVYVVKITDSYKKIAHAHHVTVAQLKEANHIKGDTLHTGQKLFIPSEHSEVAEAATATSTLASAPTTTVSSISTAPMTTGLTSTTTSEATAEHHHLYTIVKGDTLTKIAHRFKTTPKAIMAVNDNLDPTKLTIGKKLRIPSKESRSAINTAPVAQPAQVQAKSVTAPTGQLATYRQ